MPKRSLLAAVLALSVLFTLLAPAAALADSGGGPYYLAISQDREAYIRGGRELADSDFGPNFRPRPGDVLFFGETLYHSTAKGAKGTRAGQTAITCTVGLRQRFHCEGVMILAGRGALYLITATSGPERFLAAVQGGTREFKAARGDVVITNLSERRSLYLLRLR